MYEALSWQVAAASAGLHGQAVAPGEESAMVANKRPFVASASLSLHPHRLEHAGRGKRHDACGGPGGRRGIRRAALLQALAVA